MSPQLESNQSPRGRRRSHNACLQCRRKKTRCPGEKPACSSCSRLNQQCAYPSMSKITRGAPSAERLATLEEKMDRILSGDLAPYNTSGRHDHPQEEDIDISEPSYTHAAVSEPRTPTSHRSAFSPDSTSPKPRPSSSEIAHGIHLYFQRFHRQPVWCFERDDVRDHSVLPNELVSSILALTSRFSANPTQSYGEHARHLIMLNVANGTVTLQTIESLCLVSYSFLIGKLPGAILVTSRVLSTDADADGNMHLAQFHIGLAQQLCRSAMLDVGSTYSVHDPLDERKRRVFWSLQLLEHFYGRPTGFLSFSSEISRVTFGSTSAQHGQDAKKGLKMPPLPTDDISYVEPSEPGIWNTAVRLGWVWSRVREYVSDCAQNIVKEPWRHDSMYAMVTADFMETEHKIPIGHRYDSVKFYERKVEEVKMNHDYWAPWLKEQFTYHAIPTVLNHPFLYIVGAQHNPNLAIPTTFWRRSSELALLHATWIVRIIDMIMDKQVPLTDPFFGHMAAIAATVHLYYCCATAARLKHKSNTDLAKCRKFLQGMTLFSPACAALDRSLEQIIRIAADPEGMELEDWTPSKLNLSVPLMWDVLQFNCTAEPSAQASAVLDASLSPTVVRDRSDDSILEVIVATSPEITVDTRDGGQEAPSLPQRSRVVATSSGQTPRNFVWNDSSFENIDNLTFNTTPWLYADPSQFALLGNIDYESQPSLADSRVAPWWEGGTLSNAMFH